MDGWRQLYFDLGAWAWKGESLPLLGGAVRKAYSTRGNEGAGEQFGGEVVFQATADGCSRHTGRSELLNGNEVCAVHREGIMQGCHAVEPEQSNQSNTHCGQAGTNAAPVETNEQEKCERKKVDEVSVDGEDEYRAGHQHGDVSDREGNRKRQQARPTQDLILWGGLPVLDDEANEKP